MTESPELGDERWQEEWELVEGAPETSGGQGTVKKVRRRFDGQLGALKEIHAGHLTHTERRLRMAREVEELQRVRGPGIPAVLSHNARFAKDKTVPLYFVSEWIEGKTLQHRVGDKPLPLEEALRFTHAIAEIIARCHAAGVLHRDIKPDNVIIREGDGLPVLVDFGTAWAQPDDSSLKTAVGQELGNRFLRLPDLSAGRERHDCRVDVTLLVGLLFFLLTGRHPRVLLDEKEQPPHEASAHLFPDDTTSDPRWILTRRIMTVGFQPGVGLRFEDAEALIQRIDEVLDPPEPGEPISRYKAEMDAYREVVDSAVARSVQRVEEGIWLASRKLQVELQWMGDQADDLRSASPSGVAYVKEGGRSAAFTYDLHRERAEDPFVRIEHMVELVGPERSSVRAGYRMRAHAGDETEYREARTYYKGPASDIERLEEELTANAEQIFARALAVLTEKVREAMGGSDE
ncbi:MAG: protein kinase [Rubrobacteraceae bacterium]|nr:protein kinase [Rubrobacteraceae bacterium]